MMLHSCSLGYSKDRERQVADLKRISGYDAVQRNLAELKKASGSEFRNKLEELIGCIERFIAFIITQKSNPSSYSLLGTLLSGIALSVKQEQTKEGSRFDTEVNSIPDPKKTEIKTKLMDTVHIAVHTP